LTILAIKLLLAPSLIVAASIVARRFGVRVGGVLAGLPVIAGPILLVLALSRGRAFAGDAATGTLLGVIALVAFVLAYVAVSRRFAWPVALLVGWTAFLIVIIALRPVHVGAVAALILACGACAATLLLLPRSDAEALSSRSHPRWDLPLRAACAVIPVVAVTGAASLLGPHMSGLLTAFPVVTPVLAAFTHAQRGAKEAARLLRGMTMGFFAYALFCFSVSAGVKGLGVAAAFALATVLALLAQGVALAFANRRGQASAVSPPLTFEA
jgi:hypothetical protein